MDRPAARARRAAVLAAALVALLTLAAAPSPALAQATPPPADANHRQLVLVVRFADDATGDGETGLNAPYPYGDAYRTRWESVLRDLNGEVTSKTSSQSLYSYVRAVSLGRCRLASVTPQHDDATGRVAYLTLPGPRGSYGASESVAAAAVSSFNAAYPSFDASSLDGDGDGMADNVLVVPETGSTAPAVGDPCWPRHATLGTPMGLGASSVRAFGYTLVDTSHLLGVGTVAHETLHVFGARDLYRGGGEGVSQGRDVAVGVWDIMAQHGGSRLMWPLAVTRQDCGWTTVETVGAGTYTLHAASSGQRQAVAVRSPLSDSEYFVLEYRRANTDIADLSALDTSMEGSPSTIGGSGLLVYRVNPGAKAEGNKGQADYVYLFRDGETGGPRGDGVGDVRHCYLSLGGREGLGSDDLSAGLADGAITLSDGQNSGIQVQVTGQTDDSVTFSVTAPTASEAGLWTRATDASGASPLPSSGVAASRVAAADSSVLQAVQVGVGGGAKVSAAVFDGSRWGALGSVATGCDLKDTAAYGSDRYVLAASYGSPNRFTLYGQTGAGPWSAVASVGASGNGGAVSVVGGTVYVLVEDGGVQVYRLDGTRLSAVGGKIPCGYVAALALVDVGGTPAVAVSDFSASSTGVWRLSGSTWGRVWSRSGAVNGLSPAFVGGTGYLYVKGQDGSGGIVAVGASGTPAYTALPAAVPAALEGSLTASGGSLYLALSAQSGNAVTVWRASASHLGSWEQVGARVVGSSTEVGAAAAGTRVYAGTVGGGAAALRWRDVGTAAERPQVPSEPSKPQDPPKPTATALTAVAVQGGARTWNGGAHTPAVTVRAGGAVVPATGYTVSYADNVSVGTATVTVTGRGQYNGTVRATFSIVVGKAGWVTVDGVRRWSTGSAWGSGWLTTGGQTYWLRGAGNPYGPAGSVATGWLTVGGQTYFLRRSDNQWGPKGSIGTGWLDDGGQRYFLRRANSPYGPKGSIGTGWLDEGGQRYFLRRASSPYGPKGSIGSGWLNEGGRRYFLRRAGSPWGPRGSLGYGWLTDGGRRYYLGRPSGAALTGSHVIGGRLYRFNGAGALV
ncbi:hypothetical protein [Caniella muris]|uniref:hypothetical protein n=1 Tax=Caniella muris TaxID=2941502 RepID=UPI00203CC3CF|nr:hypothetical protein [Caniella muris]